MQRVGELAEPLAETLGFEVLLVELATERGRRTLRVYLDRQGKPGGITVEDCANFSRVLDPILEVEGELEGQYNLEVSSPGLNRPLVKAAHFEKHLGHIIDVHIREPIESRHHFKGLLKKVNQEGEQASLDMEVDNKVYNIPLNLLRKANLDYFATEDLQQK